MSDAPPGGTLPAVTTRREFLQRCALAALAVWATRRAGAGLARRPRPPPDLDFLAFDLDLRRREDWAPVPPQVTRLHGAQDFRRITVHHSGGFVAPDAEESNVQAELAAIQAGHLARRYGDVGYHFLIDGAGRVWEGRSLAYEGAHVSHENAGNVGVALLGNFEDQHPTADQIHSLDVLLALLADHFGIPAARIYGHRDLGFSLCPGRNVYSHVLALREEG